jgi:hypothetical protein
MTKPPQRTPRWVLERLEEVEAKHHRDEVKRLANLPPRAACEKHGWSPEGGCKSNNWSAIASLCPHCRTERRRAEKEAEQPEMRTIDFAQLPVGSLASKLWERAQERQAAARGVTSPHSGDRLDLIRTAILALQHYAEVEDDDIELAAVHKCIVALQSLLANHAKNQQAAMGTTPAMRHIRRVQGGY